MSRDTVDGTSGNDYIVGDGDDELIKGFAGADSLFGGGGSDVVYGHNGNDLLHGDGGDDFIHGGNGDDFMYGGTGDDFLTGGAGADTFAFNSDWGTDEIAFKEADGDVLYVGLPSGETATLFDVQEIGDSGFGVQLWFREDDGTVSSIRVKDYDIGDVDSAWFRSDSSVDLSLLNFNLLDGTNGADTVFGTSSDDFMHGKDGDDSLDAGSGDDVLNGDAGDDTLDGGHGHDTYHVDQGADTIEISDSGGTIQNEVVVGWGSTDEITWGDVIQDMHIFSLAESGDDVVLTWGDLDGASGGNPDNRGTITFEDTAQGDFDASQFLDVDLTTAADDWLSV